MSLGKKILGFFRRSSPRWSALVGPPNRASFQVTGINENDHRTILSDRTASCVRYAQLMEGADLLIQVLRKSDQPNQRQRAMPGFGFGIGAASKV